MCQIDFSFAGFSIFLAFPLMSKILSIFGFDNLKTHKQKFSNNVVTTKHSIIIDEVEACVRDTIPTYFHLLLAVGSLEGLVHFH